MTFSKTKAADTPLFVPADTPSLLQDYTPGLQRYLLTPSYSQRWGDHSFVSVSAIFAYQRFASLGLGVDSLPVTGESSLATPFTRSNPGSYGSGMRVGLSSLLSDDLSWEVGYQSRVNMDVFNNYRGVYSELGSFDIPASANIGLSYAVSPDLKLDLSAERVMYSQIAPFTSSALPTRFLALFGSQVSPTLAWENLDVYSIGWTWRDPSDGFWSLHYSTREQPLPSDQRLQIALEPYLWRTTWVVSRTCSGCYRACTSPPRMHLRRSCWAPRPATAGGTRKATRSSIRRSGPRVSSLRQLFRETGAQCAPVFFGHGWPVCRPAGAPGTCGHFPLPCGSKMQEQFSAMVVYSISDA